MEKQPHKYLVCHTHSGELVHTALANTPEECEQISCLVRPGDHWDLVVIPINVDVMFYSQDLLAASTRMSVGITKESLPNCEWYEGIEHDGAQEAINIISKIIQ